MRKLNSLLASSLLVLGLSACVGEDDGETDGTTTIGTATTPTTTTEGTDGTTTDTTDGTSGGSSGGSGGSTTATTDPTTGGTSTTDGTGGGSTGGGADSDPNYPKPDANAMCPDGFRPATFTGMGSVCMPECMGAGNTCPSGATGDAAGQCVVNPDSSGQTCSTDDDCTMNMDESCVETGGGGMACLLPSSHCVLVCAGGATCPDGMECTDVSVCEYPG